MIAFQLLVLEIQEVSSGGSVNMGTTFNLQTVPPREEPEARAAPAAGGPSIQPPERKEG
ncbi:MAG TPA: hypothetical protein VK464_03290 [Symbiobacteriaceae bacterium]|jgi:hypothetical protein|nr:hypothetical protein [Symbiobacteriaceae bacterium]